MSPEHDPRFVASMICSAIILSLALTLFNRWATSTHLPRLKRATLIGTASTVVLLTLGGILGGGWLLSLHAPFLLVQILAILALLDLLYQGTIFCYIWWTRRREESAML